MSYDILIFEPGVVTDEDFPQWWDRVSQWEEPHHYDSIERATPAIRSFYRDLVRTFPPFNGPDALSDDEVDVRLAQGLPVADYTIGEDLVYVGVSWSAVNALVTTVSEFDVVAPGWDGTCERMAERIEALGWDRFTYRPA